MKEIVLLLMLWHKRRHLESRRELQGTDHGGCMAESGLPSFLAPRKNRNWKTIRRREITKAN